MINLHFERFERWRRRILWLLGAVSIALIAFWAAWFLDRDVVAGDHTAAYIAFEQSFVLADGWLLALALLAFWHLRRRNPSALLWLIALGGAGLYLFTMDVLYDLQHDIYASGGAGRIELAINVITVTLSVTVMRWAWVSRAELLGGRAPGTGAPPVRETPTESLARDVRRA